MITVKTQKKVILKYFISPIVICGVLVLIFILSMHVIAMNSNFPGYRGGQQDAFRHALASAYVAKYISPSAVDSFTTLSEKNLTSDHDKMDVHNNNIGKLIGMKSQNIYQSVTEKVRAGQVNSPDKDVITWLPPDRWSNFFK